jgi:hypothetical protein
MLARYRHGPYIVEEGYAMIDQDGQIEHRDTFAESPTEANQRLLEALGFDRYQNEIETWQPGFAVQVTDTNIDYRARSGRSIVMPWSVWAQYRDPYVY